MHIQTSQRMFSRLTTLLVVAMGLFLPCTLAAQIDKYSISVAPFVHDSSGKKFDSYVVECRNAALRFLLASGRFTVVERDATKELESERKLQKSESFIDGKVVEQGKATGAEYILTGTMNTRTGILSLVISRVADNLKVEGGDCILKEGFFGINLVKKINTSMLEITSRWLAKDRYTVVKELDGDDDSTDKLLIAAGTTKGIKKGYTLDVFYVTIEEIDGVPYERDLIIGALKIDLVENGNFSVAKVKDGKKDIKKALLEGKKLICRIKTKD
jgi:hypothetical protein